MYWSSKFACRALIAIATASTLASPAAYSRSADHLIVVPPSDLPELARQTGDAMLLHETSDGRTLLYIEQNNGAQLALFDVTDPGRIKSEGSAQIDAPGPFDFISSLGNWAEVVRFRQAQESAVLDLHKSNAPVLTKLQGLAAPGSIRTLGDDGFTVTRADDSDARSARDAQSIDTAKLGAPNTVFDVKNVRERLTKRDTGTTFLLTSTGLYVIRRPAVERENEVRERERAALYAGG
jgi:hypothetical protein